MKTSLVCLTALCLSLPVISANAQEKTITTLTSTRASNIKFTGAELWKYAKVSIVEARAIALKASTGTIAG